MPFSLHLDGPQRPQVWLIEIGPSSLNFELVVWLNPEATKKPLAVTAAYNWALHSALEAHGIEIPFPQRDLHVRSLFGLAKVPTRAHAGTRSPQPMAGVQDNDAVDDVNADTSPASVPYVH